MAIYDKNEASDMTSAQRETLRIAMEAERKDRKQQKARRHTMTSAAKKRDLYGELLQGIAEMKQHREGKITLRKHTSRLPELPALEKAATAPAKRKLPEAVTSGSFSTRRGPEARKNLRSGT